MTNSEDSELSGSADLFLEFEIVLDVVPFLELHDFSTQKPVEESRWVLFL